MRFVNLTAAFAISLVSNSAYAADLPSKKTLDPTPLVSNRSFDWSGLYVGLNAGDSLANLHDEVYDGYYGNKVGGTSVGGQIGYNFVMNKLVLGVEAEGDFDHVRGSNPNWKIAYHKNDSTSFLGRFGVNKGSYLPYVIAGLSSASLSDSDGNKSSRAGWAAGFGVEYALTVNLVGRIEYRFSDFGSIPSSEGWYQLHATDSTIRVGVSYYFH